MAEKLDNSDFTFKIPTERRVDQSDIARLTFSEKVKKDNQPVVFHPVTLSEVTAIINSGALNNPSFTALDNPKDFIVVQARLSPETKSTFVFDKDTPASEAIPLHDQRLKYIWVPQGELREQLIQWVRSWPQEKYRSTFGDRNIEELLVSTKTQNEEVAEAIEQLKSDPDQLWYGIVKLFNVEDLAPFKVFIEAYKKTSAGESSELVKTLERMVAAKEKHIQLESRIMELTDTPSEFTFIRTLKKIFFEYSEKVADDPTLENVEAFNEALQSRYQFDLIFDLESDIIEIAKADEPIHETQVNIQTTKQYLLVLDGKKPDPEGPKVYVDDINNTYKKMARETPGYPKVTVQTGSGGMEVYSEDPDAMQKIETFEQAAKEQLRQEFEKSVTENEQILAQLKAAQTAESLQKKQVLRTQLAEPIQNLITDLPQLVGSRKAEAMAEDMLELQRVLGLTQDAA